jgi:hypothetical protein
MRRLLLVPSLMVLGSFSLFASLDTRLLALVPAGARIVSSIDVMQARSSEFGQYLLSRSQDENRDFAEFIQETGFDPRHDLQNLIFATSGPGADRKPSRFAILARGNFDADRIRAAAKRKGATTKTYQGVELLFPQGDRQETAIAFPDPGVAVIADLTTMHGILENRGIASKLDANLQQRIDQVAGNDAWFVSLTGAGFLKNHIGAEEKGPQAQAEQALQSVLSSSGGVRFGSTVDLTIDALARSPQDATSLEDVVRFLASMAQMQRQKDPRAAILAGALDNMKLATQGSSFHLAISIPEKSLEQLAEVGPAPSHPRRQPR